MGSHTIPGVSDPHGAAQHTDVTREVFLPVGKCYIVAGTEGKQGNYPRVSGGAEAIEPDVYFLLVVPPDFVSFTSVKALWSVTTGYPSNMYWRITAYYAAPGESQTTHTESPNPSITASLGNAFFNLQEPADPLTLANLATGDILGLRFVRTGSDESDTLDTSCLLYGLLFTYVANQ